MREIIFRAKREDNGEWVYGYYVRLPDVAGSVHRMYVPAENPDESNARYYIDPETLGQFTGLKDKNGTMIFEGDILTIDGYPYTYDGKQNYFAEIVWFEYSPAFGIYTFKAPDSNVIGRAEGAEYIEDFESYLCEIVGNIHDNPELFEEGDNE